MTVSSEAKVFFSKLAKVWQNFRDYTYLEGINLSPEQISIIEHDVDQLLIEGYAGTGKSLTLLYKLINVLVQQEGKRVLYVTFNKTLIDDTKKRLNSSKDYLENKDKHFLRISTFHEIASEVLVENKVIERGISKLTIDVVNKYRDTAYRRIAAISSKYKEVDKSEYKSLTKEERLYKTHDTNFILDEIQWLKAMGFIKLESYLATERTGRSKSIRLTRAQRSTIFKIFEEYQHDLKNRYNNSMDLEDYALKIIENNFLLDESKKFDYIFVDEVQDLDPMQIKALCLLTKKSIVLSGDAKQRIYKKSPVKYEDIGLNIKEKGKRKILNKNYRSTAEIVKLANDLIFFDNEEKLAEKQFVREGDKPILYAADNKRSVKFICDTIRKIHSEDQSKTIAIIHREDIKPKINYGKSDFRLELERQLLLPFTDINTYGKNFDTKKSKQIFYTNAYDIKGLEFDTVFIVDFNNAYYPDKVEIEKIKKDNDGKDEALINEDIAEFINREKKVLYVAMTRAKDNMYLIANGAKTERGISEFINDFKYENYVAQNFTKKSIEQMKVHHKQKMKGLLGERFIKVYEPEKYKELKTKNDTVIKVEQTVLADGDKAVVDKKPAIINDEVINKQVSFIDIKEVIEPKIQKKETFIDSIDAKDIAAITDYFNNKGIEVIDKRDKGGALWIIGGMELSVDMKILSLKGTNFKFLKNGGRSSKHKPAWYLPVLK